MTLVDVDPRQEIDMVVDQIVVMIIIVMMEDAMIVMIEITWMIIMETTAEVDGADMGMV